MTDTNNDNGGAAPTLCNFDMSTALTITMLPDEKAGQIFKAFCRHCLGREYTPPDDENEAACISLMCACHDRMTQRHRAISQRQRDIANARWKNGNATALPRQCHGITTAMPTDGRKDGRKESTNGMKENKGEGDTPSPPALTVESLLSCNVGKPQEKRQRFTPPTADQVRAYCVEQGYTEIVPDQFVAYYESKGWIVGKAPMKDWKAAVRNWHTRNGSTSDQCRAPSIGRDGIRRGAFAPQATNKRGLD